MSHPVYLYNLVPELEMHKTPPPSSELRETKQTKRQKLTYTFVKHGLQQHLTKPNHWHTIAAVLLKNGETLIVAIRNGSLNV